MSADRKVHGMRAGVGVGRTVESCGEHAEMACGILCTDWICTRSVGNFCPESVALDVLASSQNGARNSLATDIRLSSHASHHHADRTVCACTDHRRYSSEIDDRTATARCSSLLFLYANYKCAESSAIPPKLD